MNGGFDPVVVNPSGFRVQRASQQTPFYFGGSQVPIHIATGGGIMRINRPSVLPRHLSKMRGGMLIEATNEDFDVSHIQKINIIAMLDETIDLLNLEAEERGGFTPNITEKIQRFPEVNRIIRRRLMIIPPITRAEGNRIKAYLNAYTRSPIQPFVQPNF